MTYKSPKQPFCRYCAKPIRKDTIYYYVRSGRAAPQDTPHMKYVEGPAHTLADCQKLTEHEVVSVSYSDEVNRHVWRFTAWDGESYTDQYFCANKCAIAFGYLMARGGHCTKSYKAAALAQHAADQETAI